MKMSRRAADGTQGRHPAAASRAVPPAGFTSAASVHESLASLREETTRLLAERLGVGMWIVLAAVILFALVDFELNRAQIGALYGVRCVQLGLVLAVFALLRVPSMRQRSVSIALVAVSAISITITATSILRHDVTTPALLFIVVTMTTATLLPWGVWPQLATVVVVAVAMACDVYWTAVPLASLAYPGVAVGIAFAASVYVAHEFEGYRLARRQAEEASVAQARLDALQEEAQVSAALARVGREMISSLDRPVILDRLCLLTTEVLGCDCSHTFLWQQKEDAYVPVAGHGDSPLQWESIQKVKVRRPAIAGLLAHLQREELAQVVQPRDPLPPGLFSQFGITAGLWVALRRGEQIIGIQISGYRGRTEPFTTRQQLIARGIAQIASLALANARLVEELGRAGRTKSEFLKTMSHELRTPVAVMLGFADIMGDPSVDADQRRQFLNRITTAGHGLLELIDSTLEIGKIEAGQEEPRLEPVQLPAFWTALGNECSSLPRNRDVALEWSADVPELSLVTDPEKLTVVLRNLVGNALKFTERGSVRAEVRSSGDAVEVRVADTGIGIRREDQETIFEMFRQADGSTTRRYGGTGLGLYIARRFAEHLGGTIAVESVPKQGSVFTVTLPRWPAALEVTPREAVAARPARS